MHHGLAVHDVEYTGEMLDKFECAVDIILQKRCPPTR